jgi:rod shape-determining protein MreC
MYRRAGRGRIVLLAFLALSIVVITLDFRQTTDVLDRAKDISNAIVTPIQRGLATVFRPVGNFFSSLSELSNLRGDNAAMRQRIEEMQTQIGEAETVLNENTRLRELLDLDESYVTMERVTAAVIARPPSNYKWAVEIDKGASDGIAEDMAVIDPQGLVGKIIRVQENTATVLLLIDPQAGASARIEGEEWTGTIRGNGSDQALSLEFVDTEAEVDIGDDVVTSAYNRGIFPPNIPIGQVSEVGGQQADTEQDIDIDPWVDFTSLDFVEVILETGKTPE